MQLLERMVFHMEQLKELEFDQYLNNYKFDLQKISTSRPRLAFNNFFIFGKKAKINNIFSC